MIFSYNWLQEYISKKLPPVKKLAALITIRGFEVDEIERKGKDWLLDISITPNRGSDCLCHIGLAKECCAFLDFKFKEPVFKIKEKKNKANISLEVENKHDCIRYTARVIKGVKVGPSPKWLKQRLEMCDLRSINNIVDAINYVMLEMGQPLHVFDLEKIKSVNTKGQKKIIIRRAKKGESLISLDNKKYELDNSVLVMTDSESLLDIAGIKGGKKPEIDNETKDIILESANFDSGLIRKTSKKLKLRTDASLRFEHGIDPNLTEKAINRACFLIQKIGKGKIDSALIDYYPKKVLSKKIKLDMDYVNSLLGISISSKQAIKILNNLGFSADKNMFITVPTSR